MEKDQTVENKTTPESPLHSLRTYQGDVEEIMKHNKTSLASIVVAEQKRKEVILDLPKEKIHNDRRNMFFIALGILLFVVGVGVNLWVYFSKPKVEPVVIIEKSKTLIGYSEEKMLSISGTKDDFVAELSKEKDSFEGQPHDVKYLNIIKKDKTPEDITQIFQILATRMPVVLSRSLENTYMFGWYMLDGNKPFIILTTNDFGNAYSGMLVWEKTMPADLTGFFDTTGVATTTKFIDEAYRNKDLRVLQNNQRKTLLMYSFIDKNTLIIAPNEDVFTGVFGKYLVNKNIR